jgi:hypothetical protein
MALSVVKRPYSLRIDTNVTGSANVSNVAGEANFNDTGHGLTTGDYVFVSCDVHEYNGFWNVERIDNDNFRIREYSGSGNVSYISSVSGVTWYECVGS